MEKLIASMRCLHFVCVDILGGRCSSFIVCCFIVCLWMQAGDELATSPFESDVLPGLAVHMPALKMTVFLCQS